MAIAEIYLNLCPYIKFKLMDIACCTDQIYLKYCITMLLSFFDHHRGEEVCVHLLVNGLHREEIQKVRDVVDKSSAKLEVYKVDALSFLQ